MGESWSLRDIAFFFPMEPSAHVLRLSNGTLMPKLGLGTWKSKPSEVSVAVKEALAAGYRHIDCAYAYQNEKEVGQGMQEALNSGQVDRRELFVVSKLWNNAHRPEDVKPQLTESLRNLGLTYLDLYLIHWPQSFQPGSKLFPLDEHGDIIHVDIDPLDTWRAMEKCVDEGLVRSIGLSNFNSKQVDRILKEARIKPAVNQIEVHPYFTNARLVEHCMKQGVLVTAYSPLGSPDRPLCSTEDVVILDEPELKRLSMKYRKSVAQVILRWCVQRGMAVIPKSVTPGRIRENIDVFDFELSAADMKAIDNCDRGMRLATFYIERDGKPVQQGRDAPHFPFVGVEY